jgi:uncharacterized protein YlxP (DUF503 family)
MRSGTEPRPASGQTKARIVVVGILQFELIIHDPESLKDKRRVVRSVKDRLHREHQVSVAEVACQERADLAVLGLSLVGSDGRHIGQVLDHILEKLRGVRDAELGRSTREILHGVERDIEPAQPRLAAAELEAEMLSMFDEDAEDAS